MRLICYCIVLLLISPIMIEAQSELTEICPSQGIQAATSPFQPGGIIISAFDAESMWVYDIERATRYPLPQTRPCLTTCRLSPDARWLTYLNIETFIWGKMRLDGTQRTPIVSEAADIDWWSNDTFLIWTADHHAYLHSEGNASLNGEALAVRGVRSMQPGGLWSLQIMQQDGVFKRYMVNLEEPTQRVFLAEDRPYFNAAAWSADGRYLAYVGQSAYDDTVGLAGGELYLTSRGSAIPQQMTFLYSQYGAVRINGFSPGQLSWSPDSTRIAFWVIELLGADPKANTGNAVIHLLDIVSGELRRYCGFSAIEHTPNPPRIVWSPDSTHIAFAGNVPGDNRGTLLLAMDVESGQLTELSEGIYPAWGLADVIAWGYAP